MMTIETFTIVMLCLCLAGLGAAGIIAGLVAQAEHNRRHAARLDRSLMRGPRQ